MKVGSMTYNALVILTAHGPLPADMFGARLWRGKQRGKVTSANGGGDYGAQMFLGRLRKLGYARTTNDPGSSLWEATNDGRKQLAAAMRTSTRGVPFVDGTTDELRARSIVDSRARSTTSTRR